MKKFVLTLIIAAASFSSFSQNCEEREIKLLELMGVFSAGMLYNTYGLIGSIADGYGHDAYNETTVTNLLNAQNKLAGNMVTLLDKMMSEQVFKEQSGRDYITNVISILKGFKIQMDLFVTYVNDKKHKSLVAYEEQRNTNWKSISKLMGIEE